MTQEVGGVWETSGMGKRDHGPTDQAAPPAEPEENLSERDREFLAERSAKPHLKPIRRKAAREMERGTDATAPEATVAGGRPPNLAKSRRDLLEQYRQRQHDQRVRDEAPSGEPPGMKSADE